MRCVFFFNDTATTEIYTLSLHDALPILAEDEGAAEEGMAGMEMGTPEAGDETPEAGDETPEADDGGTGDDEDAIEVGRSEEHTSELQSRQYLVCRLLLEKKKK